MAVLLTLGTSRKTERISFSSLCHWWGTPEMATLKCNTHLSSTTDAMLPHKWHQGQDPWSIDAATSRAETSDSTQVHPSPAHRTLSVELMLRISDRQLRVQSHTRLHSGSANETFSSRFRHRMPISPPFITYASSDMLMQALRDDRNFIRPTCLAHTRLQPTHSRYQVKATNPPCLFLPALIPPVLLAQVARYGGAWEAATRPGTAGGAAGRHEYRDETAG